jgi:hypothetical protein
VKAIFNKTLYSTLSGHMNPTYSNYNCASFPKIKESKWELTTVRRIWNDVVWQWGWCTALGFCLHTWERLGLNSETALAWGLDLKSSPTLSSFFFFFLSKERAHTWTAIGPKLPANSHSWSRQWKSPLLEVSALGLYRCGPWVRGTSTFLVTVILQGLG